MSRKRHLWAGLCDTGLPLFERILNQAHLRAFGVLNVEFDKLPRRTCFKKLRAWPEGKVAACGHVNVQEKKNRAFAVVVRDECHKSLNGLCLQLRQYLHIVIYRKTFGQLLMLASLRRVGWAYCQLRHILARSHPATVLRRSRTHAN